MLARQPHDPRKHTTHASTSPTLPTLARHRRKHATNSTPFLKLLTDKTLKDEKITLIENK